MTCMSYFPATANRKKLSACPIAVDGQTTRRRTASCPVTLWTANAVAPGEGARQAFQNLARVFRRREPFCQLPEPLRRHHLRPALVRLGWLYMRRARRDRTDHWLRRFIKRHPRFFR
ncbi:MAG: hypothetical protein FJX31_04970 [Alphaproteobacteria bacterium]|nr:hypothetical protein [Alphaproteobacteria bacterium]